jgi:hypothetical protein
MGLRQCEQIKRREIFQQNPKGRHKSEYYRRWQKEGKKTTLVKIEKNISRANE